MAHTKNESTGHEVAVESGKGVTEHVDRREGSSDGSDIAHVADVGPQGSANMTKAKWLACIALGFSYTTAFQQNACTAAIVKHIDTELGPTHYYNWMLSGYATAVAVSLPLSGGLSDIFGRKGFFIVGCCISLLGTIVALAAKNVAAVIAGMVLKGIGAGSQQLALAAIAEIVPNKHRGNAQAALDLVSTPWAIFGSLIGNSMVKYSSLTFRVNFIIGVCLNVITIVLIHFWYHPPKPRDIPGVSRIQQLAALDWIGVFLMIAGIVLTLCGLSFGGSQFPWKSAPVIGPMVVGILCLIALFIWEWKLAKRPFFPHELFSGKARTFSLLLVLTFVGGMSLYTAAAFWTQQCQGMYTRDPIRIGISSIPGGAGGAIGGFLGGLLVGKGPGLKSNHILTYGTSLKLISDIVFTTLTPNTFSLALGMGFLAMFGMGASLVALIVCSQLASEDRHLGLATLILGSVRGIGGSVAITVYTSIMTNTVKKDAPMRVAKAVLPLGLPRAALPPFITLLIGGKLDAAARIPGSSASIVEAAEQAIKWSWTLAFQRIYYAAVAFSVFAVLVSFFVKDVSKNMTDNVAVRLTNEDPSAVSGTRDVKVEVK